MPQPVLFLVGATAVGKSVVAMHLAEERGLPILSMDAMQVYRGLEIGVGKPSAHDRERVPHGGLDLVDWEESFDVARYLEAAQAFLAEHQAAATSKPVIICGGTGLYFRALTQGLCAAPAAPEELRQRLSLLPLPELVARLRECDPVMAERVDLANRRRVQRALEVFLATGRSLALWQQETTAPLVPKWRAVWLRRERQDLRNRIAHRTRAMLKEGWLEEVRGLLHGKSEGALEKCSAIGYASLAEVLKGTRPLTEVEEEIIHQTRQYAKRQETWFRREAALERLDWEVGDSVEQVARRVGQVWERD